MAIISDSDKRDNKYILHPWLPVQDRTGGRIEGKCHGLGCTWQQ